MTTARGDTTPGEEAPVIYEVDGRIGRITINRPERRNAISAAAMGGLRRAFAAAKEDGRVRAVILSGAGESAFCSGMDLSSMGPAAPGPRGAAPPAPELHRALGELAGLFGDLWELGKPTVAAVRGYALAGGFGLALACDIVIAAEDACFGAPEIDVGLWPHMITVPLTRSMPPKKALELMLTGRRVGAAEAERIGFVSRVVPAADLDAAAQETAALLASKPPEAMRLGRDGFYRTWGMPAGDALEHLHALLTITSMGEEASEGRAAFLEHRPPRWRAAPLL